MKKIIILCLIILVCTSFLYPDFEFIISDKIVIEDLPSKSLFPENTTYYNSLIASYRLKGINIEENEYKFSEESEIRMIFNEYYGNRNDVDVYLHNIVENDYYTAIVVFCYNNLYIRNIDLIKIENGEYTDIYGLSSRGADPEQYTIEKSILEDSVIITNKTENIRKRLYTDNYDDHYNILVVSDVIFLRNLKDGCSDEKIILSKSENYFRKSNNILSEKYSSYF